MANIQKYYHCIGQKYYDFIVQLCVQKYSDCNVVCSKILLLYCTVNIQKYYEMHCTVNIQKYSDCIVQLTKRGLRI